MAERERRPEREHRTERERPSARERITTPHDPLTSLVLTIPVFVVYHLGILFMDLRNGADLVTGLALRVLDYGVEAYVALTLGVAVGIAAVAWALRGAGATLRASTLVPILVESCVWALVAMIGVGWATQELFANAALAPLQLGPRALGPLEKLVMACGAGFHEELLFRVVLFGGIAWVMRRFWIPAIVAVPVAAVVSSLAFSAVHYVGALGDSFTLVSFTFRALMGLFLAFLFKARGFAVAVYTHVIYDLLVFFVFG